MAAGTASTRPRAKLRFGPKRGSRDVGRLSGGNLVMAITLSIIRIPLLLPGSLIQPAEPRSGAANRNGLQPARDPSGRNHRRSPATRIASDVADMVRVAGLLLLLTTARGERREQTVHRVIHVASGRAPAGNPHLAARVAIFLALLAIPRMAAAQSEKVETPTEMFEPERGLGVPLSGSLVLHNETLAEAQYDTNIYNVDQNRRDDFIALLDSNFRLVTRLPRHEFEVEAGGALRRYAETSDENSETYHANGRVVLDLANRIGLRARGGYARGVEMRGTAGDQFATDRPVRFDDTHVEATIDRTGGIVEAALSGSIQKRKYLDASINGTTIDLSSRDATIRRGTFQASYRISPVIRLFAQVGGNEVEYDRDIGIPRDSSGYSALAGVRYEVTRLVDLTAAVGYIHQNFDAPGTKSVSGINYRVEGTWTPTPMWRVVASGERTIDASPLNNVPAIVRSSFDLRVQRAFGDRMLAEARVSYTDEDYHAVDRNDRRFGAFANVQYRVIKNVSAVVGAGYRKQTGGRDYEGASFSVGLRVAL